MITKLFIENYRSILKAELPLGKINVLTGANNSGKSSVLYAALTLKSLVSNPNRSLDAILTLPFINLGGFEQIIHQKNIELHIQIGCEIEATNNLLEYRLRLGKQQSTLVFNGQKPYYFNIENEINFPYPLNKIANGEYEPQGGIEYASIDWNGITASDVRYETTYPEMEGEVEKKKIETYVNLPVNWINKIDYVPNVRGFTKPFFGMIPLQSQITNEDEIATLLAADRDLEGAVAFYFEKIVDKIFNVRFTGGTSNYYLQVRDKQTGFTTDLVNEGTGINQLVTILAKTLKKGSDFICIDEPEIHLHPTYISRLAKVLVEIAENENKQFLISTHSEHLVSSLLNLLITRDLKPDDLHVFYCSKKGKSTVIEKQAVNDKGQIEGGFKSFIDAELQNTKTLFQIK